MSAATDHLGPQFLTVRQVGRLTSGDWDVPMRQVIPHPTMGKDGRLSTIGHPGSSGGSRSYSMEHLTNDIAAHGVREPIGIETQRHGEVDVYEGHHRYVAARQAGAKRIPVSYYPGHDQGRPKQVSHAIARYTPPG